MLKKLAYICFAIFCLALAYHFGAMNAGAQLPSNTSGIAVYGNALFVMTSNGDVYYRNIEDRPWSGSAQYVGNFWVDMSTSAQQQSWGGIKAKYK